MEEVGMLRVPNRGISTTGRRQANQDEEVHMFTMYQKNRKGIVIRARRKWDNAVEASDQVFFNPRKGVGIAVKLYWTA